MTKLKANDVGYLALEGGGGKGVTYLGAIKALEHDDIGLLPIVIGEATTHRIRGISGASAGAITGLFLALGYRAVDIQKELETNIIEIFLAGPEVGKIRKIDKSGKYSFTDHGVNRPKLFSNPPYIFPAGANIEIGSRTKYLNYDDEGRLPKAIAVDAVGVRIEQVMNGLRWLDRFKIFLPDAVDIKKLQSKLPEDYKNILGDELEFYLENLLVDYGLFPGHRINGYFDSIIESKLGVIKSESGEDQVVDFETFRKKTGVDFIVTGVNITTKRPELFSADLTPQFPVSAAVAISMNIPLIFKPILIESSENISAKYNGYWVDGGTLNNFPLHAFDNHIDSNSKEHFIQNSLNPAVLGLRLTAGDGNPPIKNSSEEDATSALLHYLGSLFDTLLYPSEEGRIRSTEEKEQTIDLYTHSLSTLEFSPDPEKSQKPIQEAEERVNNYFKQASSEK